jgi:uncharacterized caspase-like protein
MRPTLVNGLVAAALVAACGGAPRPKSTPPPTNRALRLVAAQAPAAHAARRRALLIGNASYTVAPKLSSPSRDVSLLESTFRKLGIDAIEVHADLDRRGMRDAVDVFVKGLAHDDAAIVYFAGHGVEIGRGNLLLPIDFDANSAADAKDDAYPLGTLLQRLRQRNGGVNVVILDACRNDPLGPPIAAAASVGFSEPAGPHAIGDDVILWYATAPGEVAQDGNGHGTSPFATALAGALGENGEDDLDALRRVVQRRVKDATAGRQSPHIFDYTDRPFSFAQTVPLAAPEPSGPASRAAIVTVSKLELSGMEKLSFHTDADVKLVSRALEGLGFSKIDKLREGEATADKIRATLKTLLAEAQPGGRVAFHFSGPAWRARDDDGDEIDQYDEALIAFDVRSLRADAHKLIRDDELAAWIAAVRGKVGASGHVLVTLDANQLFEDGSRELDRAAGVARGSLSPIALFEPRGLGVEKADSKGTMGGLLSRSLSDALSNADERTSWRDVYAQMARSCGRDLHFAGDADALVNTGEWGLGGRFVAIDASLKYGPRSVFVKAGRLTGIFPGAEIAFYAPTGYPPQVGPIAKGIVARTGTRVARVELADATPPETLAGAFAAPLTLAMPPVSLTVKVSPSLVTQRPDLEAFVARIGLAGKAKSIDLEIVEQTGYAVLVDARGRGLSDPIAFGDGLLRGVGYAIWRYAFARYLAGLSIDNWIAIEAGDGEGPLGAEDLPGARAITYLERSDASLCKPGVSHVGAITKSFHVRQKPARITQLLQTRGFSPPQSAWVAAVTLDPLGAINPVGAARPGSLTGCYSAASAGRHVVKYFASAQPLDFLLYYALLDDPELPPIGISPARAEDETRARLRPGMTDALPVDEVEVGDVLAIDVK